MYYILRYNDLKDVDKTATGMAEIFFVRLKAYIEKTIELKKYSEGKLVFIVLFDITKVGFFTVFSIMSSFDALPAQFWISQ